MNDDLDAIRRVLAADVEAFRRLVERYQRPLLTLIRNLTPSDTDHEGIAQEVFLSAHRRVAVHGANEDLQLRHDRLLLLRVVAHDREGANALA